MLVLSVRAILIGGILDSDGSSSGMVIKYDISSRLAFRRFVWAPSFEVSMVLWTSVAFAPVRRTVSMLPHPLWKCCSREGRHVC